MIPNSYNKLPLNKYGTIREIINSTSIVGVDKDTKILSLLSGKPVEYFEQLSFKDLELWQEQISFLWKPVKSKIKKYVWIHRKLFVFITDTSEVSNSIYLGLKHHAEKGDINGDNMHNAISQILRPFSLFKRPNTIKQQNETAEYLYKYAKMGKVHAPLFFFSNTYKKLNEHMEIYLTKVLNQLNEPKAESEVHSKHSEKVMDGMQHSMT